jgi:hypothetical protein
MDRVPLSERMIVSSPGDWRCGSSEPTEVSLWLSHLDLGSGVAGYQAKPEVEDRAVERGGIRGGFGFADRLEILACSLEEF